MHLSQIISVADIYCRKGSKFSLYFQESKISTYNKWTFDLFEYLSFKEDMMNLIFINKLLFFYNFNCE